MRRIGVVTVGRSDYGIYRSVLRAIADEPSFELQLYVTGMHLAPEFGKTVGMIEEDGFAIAEQIETLLSSDSPDGIGKAMGLGVLGFSQSFARQRPDLLVVLGDRFDMFPAALAALPHRIPVAHIHGGEVSSGAIDDSLRHSITKLSHLHFVATEAYARRVIQLGEEPWRVLVSGAPALDNLATLELLSAAELERKFGLSLAQPPLLVTYHPVTLEYDQTPAQMNELLGALDDCGLPVVFTAPNADTTGRAVRSAIERYVAAHDHAWLVENFGLQAYFSMLPLAGAMVGNSSSGIIEAASFGLPVVNIGNRQAGRDRGGNVLDSACRRAEITAAIRTATSAKFRAKLHVMRNPYQAASGSAAQAIVNRLKSAAIDENLLCKRFYDLGRTQT